MKINNLLKRFRNKSSDSLAIFLSIDPKNIGGGSNTFSHNFINWVRRNKSNYKIGRKINKSEIAIVIAGKLSLDDLKLAKSNNIFIIHRLDEYVEDNEDEYRKKKHEKIKYINKFADVTVYQSNYVYENMHPYLGHPEKYAVIHNGGNPDEFYPSDNLGEYVGHVTWGVGQKKRLDILYEIIKNYHDQKFLLVGRHLESEYNFSALPNVKCVGRVKRKNLLQYLHQMKFLFFPSERDPCPNTVIEAMLAGLPICYNKIGGTIELVKDCGVPLNDFGKLNNNLSTFRQKTLARSDLDFNLVAEKYLALHIN